MPVEVWEEAPRSSLSTLLIASVTMLALAAAWLLAMGAWPDSPSPSQRRAGSSVYYQGKAPDARTLTFFVVATQEEAESVRTLLALAASEAQASGLVGLSSPGIHGMANRPPLDEVNYTLVRWVTTPEEEADLLQEIDESVAAPDAETLTVRLIDLR